MKEVKASSVGGGKTEWVEETWHMHKGTLPVSDTFELLNLHPMPFSSWSLSGFRPGTPFFRWLIRFWWPAWAFASFIPGTRPFFSRSLPLSLFQLLFFFLLFLFPLFPFFVFFFFCFSFLCLVSFLFCAARQQRGREVTALRPLRPLLSLFFPRYSLALQGSRLGPRMLNSKAI